MTEVGRPHVDVVVVAYNSGATLRSCVEELAGAPEISVIVVDNGSTDGCADTVRDLPLTLIREKNRGFAAGCNRGAAAAASAFVLFLNPDARITPDGVKALAARAAEDSVGAVAPRIVSADGHLEFSQRRFPSVVSTYAQALFLHRVFDKASWTDEVIRDPALYETPRSADWVSGACVLVRRSVLDVIGGWDESFFLYSEDTDLCRRVRSAGYEVLFEPETSAVHIGGQSSPRASLLPMLARSRIRYAHKHAAEPAAWLLRGGIALSALTHLAVARSAAARRGHARALRDALGV